MTVGATSNGGYTPDGQARIFDTSTQNSEDPDLGSPNQQCSPSGPGVGKGGIPGAPGENCEPQGNVLIIQESYTKPNGSFNSEPDDNVFGGSITFSFDCALEKLLSIGLMDIEHKEKDFFTINKADGSAAIIKTIVGLGDNSISTLR